MPPPDISSALKSNRVLAPWPVGGLVEAMKIFPPRRISRLGLFIQLYMSGIAIIKTCHRPCVHIMHCHLSQFQLAFISLAVRQLGFGELWRLSTSHDWRLCEALRRTSTDICLPFKADRRYCNCNHVSCALLHGFVRRLSGVKAMRVLFRGDQRAKEGSSNDIHQTLAFHPKVRCLPSSCIRSFNCKTVELPVGYNAGAHLINVLFSFLLCCRHLRLRARTSQTSSSSSHESRPLLSAAHTWPLSWSLGQVPYPDR